MKITLEAADLPELEVVIRGDLSQPSVAKLVSALSAAAGSPKLFLYREGREFLCDAKDVQYFEAAGDRVYAQMGRERLEARHKLYELAERLAVQGFVQISKGVLVNVDAVRSIQAEFSGNYLALLRDGQTRLSISRKYIKAFRAFVMKEVPHA